VDTSGTGPDDAGQNGVRGSGGGRRRRWRWILAAGPLALAVLLLAIGFRPGGDGAPEDPGGAPVAADATLHAGSLRPAPTADGADPSVPGAGPPATEGHPATGTSVPGTIQRGTDQDLLAPTAAPVPAPPPGTRPVAVGFADPAALSVVAAGERVDVVALDGTVLAENLEVLQDRSGAGEGPVLVLAVPDADAATVATTALSREVTAILSLAAPSPAGTPAPR